MTKYRLELTKDQVMRLYDALVYYQNDQESLKETLLLFNSEDAKLILNNAVNLEQVEHSLKEADDIRKLLIKLIGE